MGDYFRRLLIVLVMAVCITILFIGGTVSFAEDNNVEEQIWFWPTLGELTDTYGTRGGSHYGIDIAAPKGTPVITVAKGKVSKSYYSDTYGHVIFIAHNNGYETVYAHLNKRIVAEGDKVKSGEQIGTVGNTGRSSGNHLHFEVHKGEWNLDKTNAIDPLIVLVDEPDSFIASAEEANHTVMAMYHDNDNGKQVNKIRVNQGDTLYSLAKKHKVSINKIKKMNGLRSDLIYVGQQLILKEDSKSTYIVKKGDTISKIATMNDISVSKLKKDNQLNSDRIYPGDILILKK